MLVPDFPTTGEEVKQMSLEDLKQFPLVRAASIYIELYTKLTVHKTNCTQN